MSPIGPAQPSGRAAAVGHATIERPSTATQCDSCLTLTPGQPSTMLCMRRNTATSVAGLHKRYGDNEVLEGVDLEVPEELCTRCWAPTAPPSHPGSVELVDSLFLEAVPAARRLLQLLEEPGWSGWTRLEPTAGARN